MANAYTPGLKVTPFALVRKTRRLPLTGAVLVKVGDAVTAETVVARTELPGKVYPINVANQLSILPDELTSAMKKQVGEGVHKDQLLAETRSFFGIFRSDVKSPIEGTVESISRVTGQVILRERPIPVEVSAYVQGKVVEELAGEGVVVEARGAFVQGIFGLGGEVCAPLLLIARAPDDVIDETRIGPELMGKIAIGGARLTLPALKKCIEVGAAGVICGGFAYQDIKELLGYDIGVAITGTEKLGTTLVVTEGFGSIGMARATYELLARHDGQVASMNGATQIRAGVIRPEVIIPMADSAHTERPALDLGMEVHSPVRCIRAPYFGRIGVVKSLPVELVKMPSETLVRVVEVALDGGETVLLPRANVERIERN